jgi:hypothetical protein
MLHIPARSPRSLLAGFLALSLLSTAVLFAAAPGVAQAQAPSVFEGTGLVELVPPTGLVGDGASPADLYLLALGPDGAPLTGLKLKGTASGGTVGELGDVGGGLYRFTFTPPKVDAASTVVVTFKGKLGKDTFQKAWNLRVAAPRSRQLAVATNPPTVTLGQDRTASVSINLAGGDRQSLAGVDISVLASSGTVENVTALGGGQFTALYTPPAVKYPHVALLTVVDRRDPGRVFGSVAVPLVGRVDFPVQVTAGNKVILGIGDKKYGPIQSDAQGRATVPIVVPPGATQADVTQVAPDGKTTSSMLDLKVPDVRRVQLFPPNTAVPSDGGRQVPMRAFVTLPDGKADPSAPITFTATAGSISAAKHEGNGVYVAMWTPPTLATATQATIGVSLADKPQTHIDSMTVNLVSARPARLQLSADPASLATGADGFKLFAKVAGPDGQGQGGRSLQFAASGAKLKGDVKDLRNGDYQALFGTTGSGPVEISATVAAPVTGNPLARVLVLSNRKRINPDGLSAAMITIVTVDEFGYPVPNVACSLRLAAGDGTLPAEAKTDGRGIAQVYYTAGRRNTLVDVEVEASDQLGAVGLLQVPAELAVPSLPVAGSKPAVDQSAAWQDTLAELRVEREGMTGAVVSPLLPSAATARAAKASLMSDPATVSAGGTVKLKVKVEDDAGRGMGGQGLDFLVSAGTVGPVSDLGDGTYEATLSVPASASGEVKVSVGTRDGTVSSFMRVPIGGAEGAWTGANPFAPTTTSVDPYANTPAPPPEPEKAPEPVARVEAPPAATTTVVTKPPKTDSNDRPWLRASLGLAFGAYSYQQKPACFETETHSCPSTLYPQTIIFGTAYAEAGQQASPTYALGPELRVRGFVPMKQLKYLGGEFAWRGTVYSVDPTNLCTNLNRECADSGAISDWNKDWLFAAIGRYPFDVSNLTFHVGVRAGWSNADVGVYKVESGQIALEEMPINSLVLGGELAAEFDKYAFLRAGYDAHAAGASFSPLYKNEVTVEIGVPFLRYMFVSAEGFYQTRAAPVLTEGSETQVGDVYDETLGGTFNAGFQL